MANRIGIRMEDKNEWERRAALIPADVADLTAQGIEIWVEHFARRAFSDGSYETAGAVLVDDAKACGMILGIKEIPVNYLRSGGAYMFFSHTIKGQAYNMGMLAALVERKCTLLDYEMVTDDDGKRLIFFGRYAGLAGMIDTLWTLGRRLEVRGVTTPFLEIQPAHLYRELDEAKTVITRVGERIAAEGVPGDLAPMVVGFTGYGNVSRGAQEIFDLLPHMEVQPAELAAFVAGNAALRDKLVKVVYTAEDLVDRIDPSHPFDLQEYYDHPERYRSAFEPHLRLLSVLMNCIYWDERYPRLADVDQLRNLSAGPGEPKLVAVGDITCDVNGSLACTVFDTESGDPVYIYDPETRRAVSGFKGPGLAVMSVGNLPCELPRGASSTFSNALKPFILTLAHVDFAGRFENAELPDPIRRSVILWKGEFTPRFEYMKEFLR
ncbi:MAG: hypothetical protein KAW17_03905 [Candidatus Eisenbacteria sp.]|nr:hypothetical protein [Candidatus Eisenbacteria bacterium]